MWDEKQKVPEKEVEPEPKTEQEGTETISLWGKAKKDLPEEQVDVTPHGTEEAVEEEDPERKRREFLVDLGIAVMLAAIIVIFVCIFRPWQASAKTTANNSDDLTWSYDAESNTLRLSGSGEMRDYSSSNTPPWYSVVADDVTIEIEDGITSIGAWAFSDLSISEVYIPDSVEKIGDHAFFHIDCEIIAIPESVEEIGDYAFAAATHDEMALIFNGNYSSRFGGENMMNPFDSAVEVDVYYNKYDKTWSNQVKNKFRGNIQWCGD